MRARSRLGIPTSSSRTSRSAGDTDTAAKPLLRFNHCEPQCPWCHAAKVLPGSGGRRLGAPELKTGAGILIPRPRSEPDKIERESGGLEARCIGFGRREGTLDLDEGH